MPMMDTRSLMVAINGRGNLIIWASVLIVDRLTEDVTVTEVLWLYARLRGLNEQFEL